MKLSSPSYSYTGTPLTYLYYSNPLVDIYTHSDCSTPFEFVPMLFDLVHPTDSFSFHAVVPSLPGCGLSSPPCNSPPCNSPPLSPVLSRDDLGSADDVSMPSSRTSAAQMFDQSLQCESTLDISYDYDPTLTSANVLAHLMIHNLGYHQFAIAAVGDYSAKIGLLIASEYPDNCIGVHTTNLPSALNSSMLKQKFFANCRLKLKARKEILITLFY